MAADAAEAIITAVAVRLHDLECPDRTCSGSALGEYYRRAALVLDDVEPLIRKDERQRLTAIAIVLAIWAKWDAELDDWDLEGSSANKQAKQLATDAVADLLDGTDGD